MNINKANKELAEILGSTYGGPSLSFEKDGFVIYAWGDAPVSMDILGQGASIEDCIIDYKKKQRSKK